MKRFIILLLVAGMLVGTMACGGDKNEGNETTAAVTTTADPSDEAAVTNREDIKDSVPEDLDFTGQTLRVVYHDDVKYSRDIVADEMNGDVVNDAVFKRNNAVEERLGITIEPIGEDASSKGVINAVRTSVLAGSDDYDIACSQAIRTAAVVTEGIFYNLNDIDNLDFSQPWWNQNAIDQLTVDGKMYITIGDYSTITLGATYCMYVNKDLIERYGVSASDLYQTVLDGKWTYDELYKDITTFSSDLNGDANLTEDDQFGLLTTPNSPAVAYMWAFGNMLTTKGSDGFPELNLDENKLAKIVENVYNLYYNNDGTFVSTVNDDNTIFEEGRAAFLNANFISAFNFRDLEFEYGIVPYPKLDESQAAYKTMADGFHSVLCVPSTSTKTEMVGAALELLNAYSYKYVVPAYYETALKVKYTHDNESVQIMDMILDGLVFDFGYFYDNWTGYAFMLQDLMQKKSSDFSSYYASRKTQALNYFDEVLTSFKEMK